MTTATKTSVVKTEPVVDVAEEIPEPMGTFNHMPLYRGSEPKMMEKIEDAGVKIYYILGSYEFKTTGTNNVVKTNHMPQIYRVDKSLLGRSVTPVTVDELGLFTKVETEAEFELPKMPYEFVMKMDEFFRGAFRLHGTEAILVLTFDPTKLLTDNPGDGWGCIAPKQENTPAHCNYEIDLVMETKPEHCSIVGTVHSHPEMGAFFSKTDHDDQADWEGLHITFAWPKGGGPGTSNYHIEMVLGGRSWDMKPEEVFQAPPLPEVDTTEVDEWLVNVSVKKALTTSTTSSTSGGTAGTASRAAWQGHSGGVLPGGSNPLVPRTVKIPQGGPDPKKNLIVAVAGYEAAHHKCPFCTMLMSRAAWENGRCIACQSYIVKPGLSLTQVCAIRTEREQNYDINLDPDKAPNPIILWIPKGTEPDGKNDDIFTEDMRLVEVAIRAELLAVGTPPK